MSGLRHIVGACAAIGSLALAGAAAAVALPAPPPARPGQQSDAASRARIDVQAQLEAGESSLQYSAQMRVAAVDGGPLDFDRGGLQLPLLAPVVGGTVLDRGALPAGAQTVQAEADAPLRVERAGGGLVVRGVLPAAGVATVRVRSVIGFREPALRLGMRGTAGRTWTSLVVLATAPARVQLAVSRAARVSALQQANERVTGAALAQALSMGEVVTFDLSGLPAVAPAPRWLLVRLGLVLLVVAIWALLWRRTGPADG